MEFLQGRQIDRRGIWDAWGASVSQVTALEGDVHINFHLKVDEYIQRLPNLDHHDNNSKPIQKKFKSNWVITDSLYVLSLSILVTKSQIKIVRFNCKT